MADVDDRTPESRDKRAGKDKDFWDKFSSMSAFLSTILVATVGGAFTYLFNAREAAHQHNIQETQTVAQLMPYLTSEDQNKKRTAVVRKNLVGSACSSESMSYALLRDFHIEANNLPCVG